MSWPLLPRVNPCLPCLVGNPRGRLSARALNPLTPRERRALEESVNQLERLPGTGKSEFSRGYVSGLKRCTQMNPGVKTKCSDCGKLLLRSQMLSCPVCDRMQCDRCGKYCKKCGDGACSKCWKSGLCPMCGAKQNPGATVFQPGMEVIYFRGGRGYGPKDGLKGVVREVEHGGKHAWVEWDDGTATEAETARLGLTGQIYRNSSRSRNPAAGWSVWHKQDCAKVARAGTKAEDELSWAGYTRVGTYASHDEADLEADAFYGGRKNPRTYFAEREPGIFVAKVGNCTAVARKQMKRKGFPGGHTFVVEADGVFIGVVPELENASRLFWKYLKNRKFSMCNPGRKNSDCSVHIDMPGAHRATGRGRTTEVNRNPKLMVLNPGDSVEAAISRKLGRALSAKEKAGLAQAQREFKTTHGREATARDVVPVSAAPGTPLVVNALGDLDRIDYTVKFDSERRGRWTHKAGDHGRQRTTRPPVIATIPGRSKHNYTIVEPKGSNSYFKPTHGLMG